MRVVVTGAAGFIGSTLACRLLSLGHQVLGIDSLTDYYDPALKRSNLESMESLDFSLVETDLLAADLDVLLAGADAIFHLAGQPGVRGSWGSKFSEYTRANVDATQRVLEASIRIPDPIRFIYASSSSIYGQSPAFPTSEADLPRPFSPYGVTKLAGEHLVALYRENFGLETTSFRFFTVYGPRQRPDMAFSKFFRSVENGTPIDVYGDGEQIRDFTFVDDVVDALVSVLSHSGPTPPVMNLSGGSNATVNETLRIIQHLTGSAARIAHRPELKGDVRRTGGTNDLARTALNWRPAHSLEQGLAAQFDWLSSGR